MGDFLNDISNSKYLQFAFWLLVIFILNRGILGVVSIIFREKDDNREKLLPAIKSLLNWIAFYGSVLLFLIYFSNTKWLFYPLYTSGGVKVTAFLIIVAVMLVSLAHRVVKLVTRYVLRTVYEHYDIDKGLGYTINQIVYYVIMIAALAVSFMTVGLDLTAFGAIFGVLGIGIGFGMRNVAGNFISGIIILFERPIEIDEVIQINGKIGRVEKIRLRSTVVRTAKEGTLVVPNQYFIEQIIRNRTGAEIMAQVTVSVRYGTDTEKVHELLLAAADKTKKDVDGILNDPEPEVRFINFRNRALDFLVELPVTNFEIKEKTESRIRHNIAKILFEHEIKLAAFEPHQSGTDFAPAQMNNPPL